MHEPGPMGEWTFKDLTAHLAAWRNHRIPMIEAAGRGAAMPRSPWPSALADDDYDSSFERLAAALEALPESVAHDPHGLPWMGGVAAIDADFTEHLHEEHVPAIRAWLASRP